MSYKTAAVVYGKFTEIRDGCQDRDLKYAKFKLTAVSMVSCPIECVPPPPPHCHRCTTCSHVVKRDVAKYNKL